MPTSADKRSAGEAAVKAVPEAAKSTGEQPARAPQTRAQRLQARAERLQLKERRLLEKQQRLDVREQKLVEREFRPANPPPPANLEARGVARELRRSRARRLLTRLALFVALPTLLAAIYFGAVASRQFESFSVFTIHSVDSRQVTGLESLLSVTGAPGTRDALVVRDYALSRDMLARLDKEHGFIAHYRDAKIDWWSRLAADASFEDAYEYFNDKVYADFDSTSGSVTLRVRAFSPEKSLEFARAVLSYSEEMVNNLSERERKDRTQSAEEEVKKAEERLTAARKGVLAVQQKHAEFNPLETASASMTVRTQLEAEVAKARAEVMELRAYMNADAPQVKAAQERVNSLSAQVAQESRRLVDPKKPGGLNTSLADFETATIEKEFAQKAYESALTALELARSDAARQHRYLATIASPSKPDESTYPRRLLGVLTAFVVSFLVMGIGILVGAAVREHARL